MKEIAWSHGVYLNQAEVAATFNVELPRKRGIGINEPSPAIFKYIAAFFLSMILVLLVDAIVTAKKTQHISFNHLQLTNEIRSTDLVSEPFTLTAAHSIFKVHAEANVINDWVDLEYRLTNQDTGETRIMNREVAYYFGADSDGSWSEGSTTDDASLANVAAGTYVLEVNGESGAHANVSISISATHGEPSSKNFWLVFMILMCGPLLAGLNNYYFERKRWSASDHPWE